jgi:hypothetical protein
MNWPLGIRGRVLSLIGSDTIKDNQRAMSGEWFEPGCLCLGTGYVFI